MIEQFKPGDLAVTNDVTFCYDSWQNINHDTAMQTNIHMTVNQYLEKGTIITILYEDKDDRDEPDVICDSVIVMIDDGAMCSLFIQDLDILNPDV